MYKPIRTDRKVPVLDQQRLGPEAHYWQNYKSQVLLKEFSSITSIAISPARPYDIALTTSARLQVYSSFTNTLSKSIASPFKDVTLGCDFRSDGKLLAASDATGQINLFDAEKKIAVRSLPAHPGNPTRLVKFFNDKQRILSGSDDQTCAIWDIPTETRLGIFSEHTDYVRAGVISSTNDNIFLSGSYDHTVKLWDSRNSSEASLTMDHGAPVESVLLFSNDAIAVSAGKNYLKVWDLLAGGRLLHTVCNHLKTITCMTLDSTRTKILTGSLDQFVKVYDTVDYSVVQSLRYPSPILSMGLSTNDNSHLVVGMTNGVFSIRERKIGNNDNKAESASLDAVATLGMGIPAPKDSSEEFRVGSYRYFLRGALNRPDTRRNRKKRRDNGDESEDDDEPLIVSAERQKKLKKYDLLIRKFQFREALDAALQNGSAAVVVSVIEQLCVRRALKTALSGRDEVTLAPILNFLIKKVTEPSLARLLVGVAKLVLAIYKNVVSHSIEISSLLTTLGLTLKKELELQKKLFGLHGMMDVLVSNQNIGRKIDADSNDNNSDIESDSSL